MRILDVLLFVLLFFAVVGFGGKAFSADVIKAPDGTVTVTWLAPADTGGLPLTEYRLFVTKGGPAQPGDVPREMISPEITQTDFNVADFSPVGGDELFVQLTAHNAAGSSPFSDPSTVLVASPPGKPAKPAVQ